MTTRQLSEHEVAQFRSAGVVKVPACVDASWVGLLQALKSIQRWAYTSVVYLVVSHSK